MTLTSRQIWRRLNDWLDTDDALDRRRELRAERIQAELAWLESDEGKAWRARIASRLACSRAWLVPPTWDRFVARHLALNEDQRLDPPPRIG